MNDDDKPRRRKPRPGILWIIASLAGLAAATYARLALDVRDPALMLGTTHFVVAVLCMTVRIEEDERDIGDVFDPPPDRVGLQLWFNLALALFYCWLLPALAKGVHP